MLSDSAILKKIERQPKGSAGYKQLVRELGLHGNERQKLSERLQRLASGGQLIQLDSDRYAIPKAGTGKYAVVGRLSMHRDGFGFVTPDPSSLDERLKAKLAGDIFIPPPAVGSAMHGDQVLVEIVAFRPEGRAEGRIVRPVARAHSTVVGIFHYGSRGNYVTPFDQKISQQILIPPGMEYPEEQSSADSGSAGVSPAVPRASRPRQKKTAVCRPCPRQRGGPPHRMGRSRRCSGGCRNHRLAVGYTESAGQSG